MNKGHRNTGDNRTPNNRQNKNSTAGKCQTTPRANIKAKSVLNDEHGMHDGGKMHNILKNICICQKKAVSLRGILAMYAEK